MLAASTQRILDRLGPNDVVLDVGGGWRPFTRANWVMDLMPYEARGAGGADGPPGDGPARETFSSATWIQRDICDRDAFPFADKELDFVLCSHTLEDVRDPVWVCSELVRVAKAGYVEVPSRLEEQAYGFQGPWVGWGHHRWLIEITDARIEFVFKHHVMHGRQSDHFPAGFRDGLPQERLVETLWWEGSFDYCERVFSSAEELDPYLAEFVARHLEDVPGASHPDPASPRLRRLLARAHRSMRR